MWTPHENCLMNSKCLCECYIKFVWWIENVHDNVTWKMFDELKMFMRMLHQVVWW
jgi:hypothetical protein